MRNYERLEFLGDTLLKFLVTAQLFIEDCNADENVLSDRREEIVKNHNLAAKSKKFRLVEFINFGKVETRNN